MPIVKNECIFTRSGEEKEFADTGTSPPQAADCSEVISRIPSENQHAIQYPHLDWLAREYAINADALVEIFMLEQAFHSTILATAGADDRKRQYNSLYNEVHRLKRAGATAEPQEDETTAVHARMVQTFRREMENKSVLEVGCGNGQFLSELVRLIPHGRLCGLDTSDVDLPQNGASIEFLRKDIIDFEVEQPFDVVYSHQVLEHIAPADLPTHLQSVQSALKPGGKLIVVLPNRFWGPQDITRIIDNTFTGRVRAMGSHLNESSYGELLPILEAHGFHNIRTILPFGAYIPALRHVRVRPWLNQFFERNAPIRLLANAVRVGGRPVFKNPITLACNR